MRAYQSSRRVEFHDTDAAGIAHFSAFFLYMEEVEHEFLRSVGLSVVMDLAGEDGSPLGTISWPRVSARCDYQNAVRFEDVLNVELTVRRLGEKSVTYGFAFSHLGRPVAQGEMTSVYCLLQPGQPPQAIPIPPDIRETIAGGGRDKPS